MEKFVEENPNSTEAEQEAFLIRFVEKNGVHTAVVAGQDIATYGIGDYIPGFSSLNETERKLAAENPVQAVLVYNCSTKAQQSSIMAQTDTKITVMLLDIVYGTH